MRSRQQRQQRRVAFPMLLLVVLLSWEQAPHPFTATAFVPSTLPVPTSQHGYPQVQASARRAKLPPVFSQTKEHESDRGAVEETRSPENYLLGFLLTASLVFGPLIPEAQAGFGPSSGATTSPPPGLTRPNVQDADLVSGTLSGKKLKILIGSSLDDRRLETFSAQLDDIIETLKERGRDAADTTLDAADTIKSETMQYREEIEKAQLFRSQVQAREKMLDKLEAQPYWFNYLAAFVGSLASTLVMHPVDTIKTRLQLRGLNKNKETTDDTTTILAAATDSTLSTNTTEYTSYGHHSQDHSHDHSDGTATATLTKTTFETAHSHNHAAATATLTNTTVETTLAVHHHSTHTSTESLTIQEEDKGLASLYEGLTGNIFKEAPPSALYLGVYETVKYSLVPQTNPAYLLLVYLVAGAAGELVGSIVRAPAEAVKSLVQSRAAGTALEASRQVLGTPEGRQNVLRAWSASLTRDIPFGAIQLAIFELSKAYILNNPNIEIDSSTLTTEAVIGAFAGGCGALLTNPTDVITTRIITQSIGNDNTTELLDVFGMGRKMYQEEGLQSFFTGWTARVCYWAPAISIFLTCYCSVRQAGVQNDFFGGG